MEDPEYEPAALYPLPKTPFYSVELPGYVNRSSPASVQRAIDALGGIETLDTSLRSVPVASTSTAAPTFRREAPTLDSVHPVELHLRPNDPYAHPVPGDTLPRTNLVLKITTRRKRRKANGAEEHMEIDSLPPAGASVIPENESLVKPEYTAEVVGTISKTVRFRSMADFQYAPPLDDRIWKLREAMDRMDARTIQGFTFEPELEDYSLPIDPADDDMTPNAGPSSSKDKSTTDGIGAEDETNDPAQKFQSNLRLFPPPVFSRQVVPHIYNYKANPVSIVQTIVDETTGEERERLVNKNLWKGDLMSIISIDDAEIVNKANDAVLKKLDSADQNLVQLVRGYLNTRPMWSRLALFNRFTRAHAKELQQNKTILAALCYGYRDGPFTGLLIRIGFDPRTEPESYQYQRLSFRDTDRMTGRTDRKNIKEKDTIKRASQANGGAFAEIRHPESHMFDGQTLLSDSPSFQLCDIEDPVLKIMWTDPDARREEFDPRDGWFEPERLSRIRALLRHKLFLLRSNPPRALSEAESYAWLDLFDQGEVGEGGGEKYVTGGSGIAERTRRKKNRPKAELDPTERTAARLRAMLEQEQEEEDMSIDD